MARIAAEAIRWGAGGGGLKCILLAPNIRSRVCAAVKRQQLFSSCGGFLNCENRIYYDETKKRAHDSKIVRAKKSQIEPRWTQPNVGQALGTNLHTKHKQWNKQYTVKHLTLAASRGL